MDSMGINTLVLIRMYLMLSVVVFIHSNWEGAVAKNSALNAVSLVVIYVSSPFIKLLYTCFSSPPVAKVGYLLVPRADGCT